MKTIAMRALFAAGFYWRIFRGWMRAASRSGALRNSGLKPRIPSRVSVEVASAPATVTVPVNPPVTTGGGSSGYPDGSANASVGTPQLPNLFSGDAVRRPSSYPVTTLRSAGTTGGPLTDEFNLMENGAMVAGAHLNFLQFGNGDSVDPLVAYNTLVQDETAGGAGEGVQMYTNGSGGSIVDGTITNDTMVGIPDILQSGAPGPAVSSWIHAGTPSGTASNATGTVSNNYINSSSAYGPIYPGLTGFAYANNIDLLTGSIIPA